MENSILFLEDEDLNRENGIKAFNRYNIKNIVAPNSIEECKEVIQNTKFYAAILDYKLTNWVGNNLEYSIELGGRECHNGIEIAEFIKSINAKTTLGIYSTSEFELRNKIDRSLIKDSIEVISQLGLPNNQISKFLPDFALSLYKINTNILPFSNFEKYIPNSINVFYKRKIINSLKPSMQVWKAGDYTWVAGINKAFNNEVINHISTLQNGSNLIPEEYQLILSRQSFNQLIGFSKINNYNINVEDFDKYYLSSEEFRKSIPNDPLIYEILATTYLIDLFISGTINLEELISITSNYSSFAKFEIQRQLYIKIQNNPNFNIKSKEDIYQILNELILNGFPMILDIFHGRVDSIEADVANVKLTSYSPENIVMNDKINATYLYQNGISENSNFEMTVYRPGFGGNAIFFEPL